VDKGSLGIFFCAGSDAGVGASQMRITLALLFLGVIFSLASMFDPNYECFVANPAGVTVGLTFISAIIIISTVPWDDTNKRKRA
jgi:hypothetical protein